MKTFFLIIFSIALAIGSLQSQTLLTETTWGGEGSDVADGVASAADGSAYVVGISDSFATDPFGNPSPRIFVVKFAPDGSLSWQKIWNGTTIRGLGRPDVAVSADGSVYVTGVTAENGNDAVLLKFDANGTLLWERAWGGAASDESFAVATAPDGSVYIAGTATSFGPSSAGLFVVKFDSAGNLVWQRISDGAAGNAVAVASDGSVYAAGTTPRNLIGDFDMVGTENRGCRRSGVATDLFCWRSRGPARPNGGGTRWVDCYCGRHPSSQATVRGHRRADRQAHFRRRARLR